MQSHDSCPLYPCFDTLTGAEFKRDPSSHIIFDCRDCRWFAKVSHHDLSSLDSLQTIEKLYFKKIDLITPVYHDDNLHSLAIINCLKNTKGLSKSIHILNRSEKKEALELEKSDNLENIGIYSALKRDISIAFAHNIDFRPPPMPVVLIVKDRDIIGEMTSSGPKFYRKKSDCDYVLPPLPFPEAEPFGKDIVSASPGYLLDTWIRKKLSIKKDEATLLLGLNLRQ